MNSTKTLKETARDRLEIDDKQLFKKLAQKNIHPYFFTHKILKY